MGSDHNFPAKHPKGETKSKEICALTPKTPASEFLFLIERECVLPKSDAVSGFMQDMELDADGNVAHTTDFRRVYASLIEGWFGYQQSRALLSGDFAPLAMFGRIPGKPTSIFQRVTRSPTEQKSNPTVTRVVNEDGDENQKKIRQGKWETLGFVTLGFVGGVSADNEVLK